MRELRSGNDGSGRPFAEKKARDIIERVLSEWDGWGETRPTHRAQAGRVERELRAAGFSLKRKPRVPSQDEEQ